MTDTQPSITDRLADELAESRRQTGEAAAALRAEAQRAAQAVRADQRYAPEGRLDALGRLEADTRDRMAQIAAQHRQVLTRVGERAYASARGQLDGDVALRRSALDAAGRLDSPDAALAAIARATVGDDPGAIAAIATVSAQRGWSGVEVEVAERRDALDALALAREAARELTPDPRDLQQRMFSPLAPPEVLTGDERATLGRLERATAEGA